MGRAGYNCGQRRLRGGRDVEKRQKSRSGSSRNWGKSLPTRKKNQFKGPEADRTSKSSWVTFSGTHRQSGETMKMRKRSLLIDSMAVGSHDVILM